LVAGVALNSEMKRPYMGGGGRFAGPAATVGTGEGHLNEVGAYGIGQAIERA